MQELIDNAKIAKEHSKDGYVTYDEVIEVATSLLAKEKNDTINAYESGAAENDAGRSSLKTIHENSIRYFTNHFKQL